MKIAPLAGSIELSWMNWLLWKIVQLVASEARAIVAPAAVMIIMTIRPRRVVVPHPAAVAVVMSGIVPTIVHASAALDRPKTDR
jgi:hypothetical protein